MWLWISWRTSLFTRSNAPLLKTNAKPNTWLFTVTTSCLYLLGMICLRTPHNWRSRWQLFWMPTLGPFCMMGSWIILTLLSLFPPCWLNKESTRSHMYGWMVNSAHSFLLKLSLKLYRVLKIRWRMMSLTRSRFLLTQMTRRHSLEDTRTVDLIEGKMLLLVTIGWDSLSSFSPISTQMSPLVRHAIGGKPVTGCLSWLGGSDMSCLPKEPLILWTTVPPLLFFNLSSHKLAGVAAFFVGGWGGLRPYHEIPALIYADSVLCTLFVSLPHRCWLFGDAISSTMTNQGTEELSLSSY